MSVKRNRKQSQETQKQDCDPREAPASAHSAKPRTAGRKASGAEKTKGAEQTKGSEPRQKDRDPAPARSRATGPASPAHNPRAKSTKTRPGDDGLRRGAADTTSPTRPTRAASGRPNRRTAACSDQREALYNDRRVGTLPEIQLPLERITSLRAILIDVDLELYRDNPYFSKPTDAAKFYHEVVADWLERHSTLAKAGVRCSGSGLHVLLMLADPLKFADGDERERWAAVVRLIQHALPGDPRQPGLTAATRPIGAVNSKNNGTVTQLRQGEGVSVAELEKLREDLAQQPFQTIFTILAGDARECPKCAAVGVEIQGPSGRCYHCGRVELEDLYETIYTPEEKGKEVGDDR